MAGLDFRPGSAAVPTSKVEISVSARNLRDRDTFSKSDPMCVLFMKSIGSNNYLEVGRTEMIKDCLNPEFVKKFIVDYFFEESQKLKFELYDVDSPSSKLNAHDFLGRIECTLGEIVGASGGRLNRKLSGLGNNPGTITVRAEELSNCKELVTLNLSGTKLDKKDTFGKSDPFLVISRVNDDNSFTAVHKTEVIKNTLNPTWRPFTLKVGLLCHGDHNRTIKFDCYDWDSDGSHDFIGAFQTTLEDLRQPSKHFELINPKKKAKKKGYKNSGVINVLSCRIEEDHTFLDYVQGGMEINFTVAIDFTASNGDPRTSQSLHYMNTQQPNHYVSALTAVGEIIQDYDTDKMFPALGFGAKLPSGKVSHEFFLNGDATNPYCQGIAGVLAAYQRTLHSVQLWGPTNFSPVINHVAKFAEAYQDGSHYFVLLILTDGVITDMPQTKHAIVRASSLPMSIIIVGVGEAEFDAMEELDADNQRLSAYGRYAERDIVQFVPFREFVGGRYGSNLEMSKAYLAKEVLAEIPDQVTGFMRKKGIKPRPPRTDSTQTQSVGPAFNAQPQSQTGFTNGMPPNQPTQGTTGAQPTAGYGAPPPAGQQGGYGALPPIGQQAGYGAPPPAGQQAGYGAPPPVGQQAGYGAPPPAGQQPGYGAPPPAGPGYGAPPPAGQQAGYGAPPPAGQQAGYGAPPPAGQQAGYGAPPPAGQQAGYGAPPPAGQQAGYGAPPPAGQQAGYGAPPPAGQQAGYGAPPPAGQQAGYGTATGGQKGAYGAPAPGHQGAYGAPAPGHQGNYGAPASGQQGAYGAPAPGQQGAYGAPAPGQQGAYGAPAPGQQSVYGAPAQHQQSGYGTSAPARQSGYGTSAPAHQSGYGAPS